MYAARSVTPGGWRRSFPSHVTREKQCSTIGLHKNLENWKGGRLGSLLSNSSPGLERHNHPPRRIRDALESCVVMCCGSNTLRRRHTSRGTSSPTFLFVASSRCVRAMVDRILHFISTTCPLVNQSRCPVRISGFNSAVEQRGTYVATVSYLLPPRLQPDCSSPVHRPSC